MIRDLTDDQARAALPLKWGEVAPGVIPAWVAEMDFRPAEPIEEALVAAVRRGTAGYPGFGDGGLGAAFAGFAARHWGWPVPAEATMPTGTVMGGIRLALEILCPPGPVVVPMPCYPPFRDAVALTGRELVPITLDADDDVATMDLPAIERAFASGARTFLLCSPHNPLGRCWTRDELAGLAELARRYDVRVIADEIHAPLTLPGTTFTPYLTLDERAVVVTSASKPFNIPGVHGAQLVLLDPADRARVAAAPIPAQHSWSVYGMVAGVAAWSECDDWLRALIERIDHQRSRLGELRATHLPEARMRPLEATYLAWLDLRAYGVADPAAAALAHGVRLGPGADYQPGLDGHVRVNLATSPERLEAIVHRLATALT